VSTIIQNSPLCTMINVFTVAPERQQELVDLLVEATDQVMRKLPGFVSANIHKSLDGVRVTNYAQWESKEAWEAMLHHAEARPHIELSMKMAERVDYHLYTVEHVARREAETVASSMISSTSEQEA
jgi:heme-degrading monooxygenase HmoA